MPKTKANTSTKKLDQPPKSDPSRANPNRKKPTGNEAAFRNKDTGREKNKSKPTDSEEPAKGKKPASRPHDRSKSFKTDSQKQVGKSWGSDKTEAADEVAAKNIAAADKTADAIEDSNANVEESDEDANKKTLDEYLAELSVKSAGLSTNRPKREISGAEDPKWSNAKVVAPVDEELVVGNKSKTLREKKRKEKIIIETEITFASPKRESSPRDSQRREGKRPSGLKNPNRSKGPRAARPAVPTIPDESKFPALGA